MSNLNRVPADVIEQLPPEAHYGRVDLLPGSIRLIDVQDRMQDIAARSHYAVNPMEVVRKHVAPHFGAFDYVLIDCPPNLGFVTQNGLEVSDHYLIPTIPDRLIRFQIESRRCPGAILRGAHGKNTVLRRWTGSLRLSGCSGIGLKPYEHLRDSADRGTHRGDPAGTRPGNPVSGRGRHQVPGQQQSA
ncbi:ParA family protein [Deinococcus taklimakanensis]|uniref:ParA family protein n=1 Tax=Deinococcus taklimakanensis TaxID=536443 RepID=A0ABW5P0A8_9DEIO